MLSSTHSQVTFSQTANLDAATPHLPTSDTAIAALQPAAIPCAPRLMPSVWVKLHQLPTAYSFDEALLLCQMSETQWMVWIPDYGESLLSTHEFSAQE